MNFFILLFLIFIITAFVLFFKNQNKNIFKEEEKLKGFFEKKEYFFEKTEKIFWDILNKNNYDNFILLSKVRMEDIVKVGKNISWENKAIKRNYIKSKHFDFVILDKNGKILTIIELDGKSHNLETQKKYDQIKDEILKNVNLKLFRVKIGENFEEKVKEIFNFIKS